MSTKATKSHPFAAIEHRVIDSSAYAALGHSACRLLTILARQLTKDNNGNLQATFTYCQPRGIGSEHTLSAAIADLIAHGFIYRSKAAGANKQWARYAVTWLPVKKPDGLFMAGFVSCAWRKWEHEKKISTALSTEISSRKCSLPRDFPAGSAGNRLAESADYELVTNIHSEAHHPEQTIQQNETAEEGDNFTRVRDDEIEADCWMDGECRQYVIKRKMTAPAIEQARAQIAELQSRRHG